MTTADLKPDPSEEGSESDFGSRELCPDDACIGLLDENGVCRECGAVGESTPASDRPAAELDLLHRTLCPDGDCIGIMGPDGRCKECGKVGAAVTTDPRLRGLSARQSADDSEALESGAPNQDTEHDTEHGPEESSSEDLDCRTDESEHGDSEHDEPEHGLASDDVSAVMAVQPDSFAKRQLCPDGSCIGIIGSGGTCNECGIVA